MLLCHCRHQSLLAVAASVPLDTSLSELNVAIRSLASALGCETTVTVIGLCAHGVLYGETNPLFVISPLQAESTVIQSTSCCSLNVNRFLVGINQTLSEHRVVETVQHELHCPWCFTGATAFHGPHEARVTLGGGRSEFMHKAGFTEETSAASSISSSFLWCEERHWDGNSRSPYFLPCSLSLGVGISIFVLSLASCFRSSGWTTLCISLDHFCIIFSRSSLLLPGVFLTLRVSSSSNSSLVFRLNPGCLSKSLHTPSFICWKRSSSSARAFQWSRLRRSSSRFWLVSCCRIEASSFPVALTKKLSVSSVRDAASWALVVDRGRPPRNPPARLKKPLPVGRSGLANGECWATCPHVRRRNVLCRLVAKSRRVIAHHRNLLVWLSRQFSCERRCASHLLSHSVRLFPVLLLLPGVSSPSVSCSVPSLGTGFVVHDSHASVPTMSTSPPCTGIPHLPVPSATICSVAHSQNTMIETCFAWWARQKSTTETRLDLPRWRWTRVAFNALLLSLDTSVDPSHSWGMSTQQPDKLQVPSCAVWR